MNYKTVPSHVLINSIDFFSYKDDVLDLDEKNAEEVIENLKNTIFNFETTQTLVDDLKTIQRCLNAKVKVDLDEYLPNCEFLSIVIHHLKDESYEVVKEILITLYIFTQRYKSEYTLFVLCNQIEIFSDLIDHKDIISLLPNYSPLLHQVIKYDDGSAASKLVKETTFIEKISEILKPPNDNQVILTTFINCINCVLKKLSKEEFHECSTKFDEQAQNSEKKKLLSLPFANVCEYIFSDDPGTLISILKLYNIILINRETNSIEKYLTEDIFNRIGFLLEKSHELDPNGFLLKRILKIIDVFIFVYIGNMEKYGDRVKLVIKSLINQIEKISLPADGVNFDKSLQWLPYIIDILSRISSYQKVATEIFSEKNCIDNLFQIYENMNYRMKCDLSYIFLNAFKYFPERIINDCDQKDDGDKYDFIGIIMNDAIESLQNNEEKEKEKVKLIFEVLFNLFRENLELKMLFDDKTMNQLFDDYRDNDDVYDFCCRVINLYEQPLDEVDELNIVS